MSGTFVKQSLAPKLALGCRLVPTLKHARLKMDAMLPSMHGGHKSPAHLSRPSPLFCSYEPSIHSRSWSFAGWQCACDSVGKAWQQPPMAIAGSMT